MSAHQGLILTPMYNNAFQAILYILRIGYLWNQFHHHRFKRILPLHCLYYIHKPSMHKWKSTHIWRFGKILDNIIVLKLTIIIGVSGRGPPRLSQGVRLRAGHEGRHRQEGQQRRPAGRAPAAPQAPPGAPRELHGAGAQQQGGYRPPPMGLEQRRARELHRLVLVTIELEERLDNLDAWI